MGKKTGFWSKFVRDALKNRMICFFKIQKAVCLDLFWADNKTGGADNWADECSIENKFDEISKSAASSSPLQLSPRKLSSSHLKSSSSAPSKKTSWSLKSLLSGFVSPTQPSSRVQNSNFDDLRPLKLAMKEHRKFSWSK